MKWFRKKIWHIRIEHMGNTIHDSNKHPSVSYTAIKIFWKGHQKYRLITGVKYNGKDI